MILLYNIYIKNIIKYNVTDCFLADLMTINIIIKLFKKIIRIEWIKYI